MPTNLGTILNYRANQILGTTMNAAIINGLFLNQKSQDFCEHKDALYFIIDDNGSIHQTDAIVWSQWFSTNDRCVVVDYLKSNGEKLISCEATEHEIKISTVFVGINSGGVFDNNIEIFETMVFGGDFDGYTSRYATVSEAIVGHYLILYNVISGFTFPDV